MSKMIEDVWRKIIWSLPHIEGIALRLWQLQQLCDLHPALRLVDVVHLLQHISGEQSGEPFIAELHLLLSEVGQLLVGLLVLLTELGVTSTHLQSGPRCDVSCLKCKVLQLIN